jgi:hypothetical protein
VLWFYGCGCSSGASHGSSCYQVEGAGLNLAQQAAAEQPAVAVVFAAEKGWLGDGWQELHVIGAALVVIGRQLGIEGWVWQQLQTSTRNWVGSVSSLRCARSNDEVQPCLVWGLGFHENINRPPPSDSGRSVAQLYHSNSRK